MVQINFAQRQVNAKIVFYGPGMSGKTTNLEIVHQRAPEGNRGDLTSISTDGDRTLFFDFMPLDLGTVAGMKTSFQIYTVPGQVYYNSTRKLVLQGVDGVVFVADSSASMVEENLESLRNLEENLNEYGKSLATVAHVIQFNKRDLPDALPVDEMNAQLNQHNAPCFEAVANTGQGVFPTLKALAARVLESIHSSSGSPKPQAAPAPRQQTPAPLPPPVAPMAQPAAQPPAPMPSPPAAQPYQQQPVPQQPYAPAAQAPMPGQPMAQPAMAQQRVDPMAQTNFQPMPSPASQMPPQQGYPQQQQPAQPSLTMQQPYPQQQQAQAMPQPLPPMAHPVQQAMPAQPQMAQPSRGSLQMAQDQATARRAVGRPMSQPSQQAQPAAPSRKPAPAATPRALESTRFRPRTARPEPRPTPAAKPGGNKLFTGLFVVLALAVGAVLTKVVFTFF